MLSNLPVERKVQLPLFDMLLLTYEVTTCYSTGKIWSDE